jgi:hypothetical protein
MRSKSNEETVEMKDKHSRRMRKRAETRQNQTEKGHQTSINALRREKSIRTEQKCLEQDKSKDSTVNDSIGEAS